MKRPSAVEPRLRGFLFRCDRGRGFTSSVIFYAPTWREAEKYAKAWADPRGYVVERVPDKQVAA